MVRSGARPGEGLGAKVVLLVALAALLAIALAVGGWLAYRLQAVEGQGEELRRRLAQLEQRLPPEPADGEAAAPADRGPGNAAGAAPAPAEGAANGSAATPASEGEVFELGLLQMALDAIAQQDAARQRSLVGYLAALPERPFRRQMLSLFRDEAGDPLAAKQAADALAGPEAPAVDDDPDDGLTFGLVDNGEVDGWDYELMLCPAVLEQRDPYLPAEIDRLLDSLRQYDQGHGRIWLSRIAPQQQAENPALAGSGLFLLVDGRRASEVRHARALARRLAFEGYDFTTRSAAGSVSPWRLTLVYCPR